MDCGNQKIVHFCSDISVFTSELMEVSITVLGVLHNSTVGAGYWEILMM